MTLIVMGLAAALSACTDTSSSEITSSTTTTTTMTTSVVLAQTPEERRDELEEMAATATLGRLGAFYRLDGEEMRQYVGSPDLMAQDLAIIADGGLPFLTEPTETNVPYQILEIYEDDGFCLVAKVRIDLTETLGFGAPIQRIEVFWLNDGAALFAAEYDVDATERDWLPVCELAS